MAVTLYERRVWASRHAATKRAERTGERFYYGIGASFDAHDDVIVAINQQTPQEWATLGGTLVRSDADVEYLGGINESLWDVRVNYVHPEHKRSEEEQAKDDPDQVSFDTSGATIHMDVARSHVASHAASGETAGDFKGAINVAPDHTVNGIDVPGPSLRFEIRRIQPASVVNLAYVRTLSDLTGTVNDGTFKGFAAGEVLFLGARGQQRMPQQDEGDYEITYQFDVQKNETSITVASITVPAKDGWDYLWPEMAAKVDATANRTVSQPIAVHLERVFERKDFSQLQIGT